MKINNIFKPNNRGYKIATIGIILGTVLFGIISPNFAHADAFPSIQEIVSSFFQFLVNLIHDFCAFLVKAGAAVFESMLELGFKKGANVDIVQAGWETCRDFANMLFILIMIVIAFATILRIENFGVKKLLPKIIIIALLINFSMVFSKVIIDMSNITADFFIKDIKSTLNGKSMTATFVDSLNLPSAELKFSNCPKVEELVANCDKTYPAQSDELYDCYHNARANSEKCISVTAIALEAQAKAKGTWTGVINILISGIFGTILLIVAAFTLFAGAFFLLVRILALWFLIMIVPLAYMCYIVPSLSSNWKKWWSTFLNWCIFAPAYSFFVWLAIKICVENANTKLATSVNGTFTEFIGGTGNPFLQNPGEQILGYAFIIGLLIGGLIVAKQLGIYGADVAMKLATNARKKALGWAWRTSTRPIKRGLVSAGAGLLNTAGKLFGSKLGGRFEGRATMLKQTWWEKDPKYQKFAKVMASSSDKTVQANLSAKGPFGIIATKESLRRPDITRNCDKKVAQEIEQRIRSIGDPEMLQKFRELRADVLLSQEEIEKVISKMAQEGNLNKIAPAALKDARVVAAVARYGSPAQVDAIRNQSEAHKEYLKNSLKLLVESAFTNDGSPLNLLMKKLGDAPEKSKERDAYNNIFSRNANQTGEIDKMTDGQLQKTAELAGADGMKRLAWKPEWDNVEWRKESKNESFRQEMIRKFEVIAENLPEQQAGAVIAKLENKAVAKTMAEWLDKNKPQIVENDFNLRGLLGKKFAFQQPTNQSPRQSKQQQTQAPPPRPKRPKYRTVFLNPEEEKQYQREVEDWKHEDDDWVSQYGKKV